MWIGLAIATTVHRLTIATLAGTEGTTSTSTAAITMIERVVVSVRREQPGGVDFGCAVMVSVPAGSGNDTATMTAGMGLEGLRRSFLAFWRRGSGVPG